MMRNADPDGDDRCEIARLVDEGEQLRTALESSEEEVTRLAEERDRLIRRVTAQSRELQAANELYRRALAAREAETADPAMLAAGHEQEELRVAFEEMQVLTEELEVANSSLQETNQILDQRVAERTRELAAKNAALTASELRFRALVEGMPQLVWRASDCGEWTWASPQWQAYTGLDFPATAGWGWLDALHPDDRETARDAWRKAREGALLEFEARVLHAAENRHRHFFIRALPVVSEDGEVLEWLGTATDVDDLLRLQERQAVLVGELQHRVRNILLVVRSVMDRTVAAKGTLEDVVDHLRGRLDALGRTQVVVTQSSRGVVDLEEMIRDELLSVGAGDGPNLSIEGPDIELPADIAEPVGLAIHELTTNALKYGALKVVGARLDIRWTVERRDGAPTRLDLVWKEQGVHALVLNPARSGFGRELIEEALPYQLGAETSLRFNGGGITCTLSVPLAGAERAG